MMPDGKHQGSALHVMLFLENSSGSALASEHYLDITTCNGAITSILLPENIAFSDPHSVRI
jgi:hypothetical protein